MTCLALVCLLAVAVAVVEGGGKRAGFNPVARHVVVFVLLCVSGVAVVRVVADRVDVNVVVAAKDVAKGQVIDAEDLEEGSAGREDATELVREVDEVVGRVATDALDSGEPVRVDATAARVLEPDADHRAFPVTAGDLVVVPKDLKVGACVDFAVSNGNAPAALISNVKVLAVDGDVVFLELNDEETKVLQRSLGRWPVTVTLTS